MMDLEIRGHVALVQAASKGIARGIAEALAAEGCDLILTARGEEQLRATAEQIEKQHGVRVLPLVADSSNLQDNERLIGRAFSQFERLDIIVCNSGGPPPGGFLQLTAQEWREAADLLIVSPTHLLKTALPLLEKSPAPRFFVVTSSSTRQPVEGLTLSNTYRPGVVGMIKSLAQELAHYHVRCHSLAPGRIDTERLANVFSMQAEKKGTTPDEVRKNAISSIPAGRLGSPADFGALTAFLSSSKADYLTGGNWLVDGGLITSL